MNKRKGLNQIQPPETRKFPDGIKLAKKIACTQRIL